MKFSGLYVLVAGYQGGLSDNSTSMPILLVAQPVSQLVLLLHDAGRQILPYAKEDEESPFPSEWIDQGDEAEPVQQFRVREEIKRFGWSQ